MTFGGGISHLRMSSPPLRMLRADPSRKGRLEPARVPSPSGGKAALALRRGACLPLLAATPSAFWYKQISAACSPLPELPSVRNWVSTTCARNFSSLELGATAEMGHA